MNFRKLMFASLLVVAVTGCNGGGNGSGAMPPVAGPAPAPTPSVDAFTQAVQGFVANLLDMAAPQDVDGVAAVNADTAEPVEIY